uniref:Uncharacterized protein n=1 Tax=Arundo donax TaxID=35708 RepID=A0A0A8Y7U7_ARUDO
MQLDYTRLLSAMLLQMCQPAGVTNSLFNSK